MKKTTLLVIMIFYLPATFAAGPAGEITSLNCSFAINAALNYIKEKNIKINVTLKKGQFACITPNKKEIYIRLQSPELKINDKKHLFIINAQTYEIIRTAYSK